MTYLLVGIGGFLGAVSRFAVANWAARLFGGPFPLGTFIANVSGSFLLGVTLAVLEDKASLNGSQRHFLVAGFLGAYTTFSTFSYESLHLFQHGPMLLGVLNVVGSVALGLLGVWGGFALARWGVGWRTARQAGDPLPRIKSGAGSNPLPEGEGIKKKGKGEGSGIQDGSEVEVSAVSLHKQASMFRAPASAGLTIGWKRQPSNSQ